MYIGFRESAEKKPASGTCISENQPRHKDNKPFILIRRNHFLALLLPPLLVLPWVHCAGDSSGQPDSGGLFDGSTFPDGTHDSDTARDGAQGDASHHDSSHVDAHFPGQDGGTCPNVPEPGPVSLSPLEGESPPGSFESTTINGFHDDYLYNNANALKVGVRREWGGSIVFFGMNDGNPGFNGTNAVDANDTGREVQVAFYDPDRIMQNCAWNASCAVSPTECPHSITYLGWNPVQGGNRCNNGSGIESVDMSGGVLSVSTIPYFWNPNWDRQDCESAACQDPSLSVRESDVRVIQKLRFVRYHVVELDYTLVNLSDLNHASTAQEFPTVYSGNGNNSPDLWRLFNSQGEEINISTPGNDGFFYQNFSSPDGWVTMQDDNLTYGIGLYTENRLTAWQGWQNRSLPFNNFRPIFPFAIPGHAEVRARSYLILGNRETIAAETQWLDENLPPFGRLDSPAADASVNGVIQVHGWAQDNKGVTSVSLVINGTDTIPLNYGNSRPDVCSAWPAYSNCENTGFSGSIDTTNLTSCPHMLEIVATDGDGNTRTIDRRRIFVDN